MSQDQVIPVTPEWNESAWINAKSYEERYARSLKDNDGFWNEAASRLDWYKPWSRTSNVSFGDPVKIEWFIGGKLNVTYNCIDRHLAKNKDRIAFYWEPETGKHKALQITYQDLHDHVCRFANGLKKLGIKKGDRVTIYMPMIPEAAYAMLACARIGAVHSVVFGGFSPDSISDRIEDCESDWLGISKVTVVTCALALPVHWTRQTALTSIAAWARGRHNFPNIEKPPL